MNGKMADWGTTDNQYMNYFIYMSKLYYDVYNNGACNIEDCYKRYIKELNNLIEFIGPNTIIVFDEWY